MTKKDGELKVSAQKELDTGDLLTAQEKTKLPDTLEMIQSSNPSSLLNFLKENPEVSLSNFIKSLELMGNSDWWYTISPVSTENGTILARITIAPPDTHIIEVMEDKDSEIKRIVISKK